MTDADLGSREFAAKIGSLYEIDLVAEETDTGSASDGFHVPVGLGLTEVTNANRQQGQRD